MKIHKPTRNKIVKMLDKMMVDMTNDDEPDVHGMIADCIAEIMRLGEVQE